MTVIEYCGALLAVVYLILALYERRECWWFYILSSLAYIPVFLSVKLFGDSALQVFFAACGVYGWHNWKAENAVRITSWTLRRVLVLMNIAGLVVLLMTTYLSKFSSAGNALVDSVITVFSITTTFLSAWKILDSWLFWIAVNTLATFAYFTRGLYPTSIMYAVYAVLSVAGLIRWRREV